MDEQRLEAFILLQVHRSDTPTVDTSLIDLLQQRRDVLTLFYKILLVGLYR